MDNVVIHPHTRPEGRIGLIIGLVADRTFVYHLARVPPVDTPGGESLIEIINARVQPGFTMKDWVFEHFMQVHKLIVPCFQILGIFTSSEEQIIEKKITPICSEINEVVKKINRVLKGRALLHLHFCGKTQGFEGRWIDFQSKDNFIAKVCVSEEKWPRIVEISSKVRVHLELPESTKDNFSEIVDLWRKRVDGLQIRFRGCPEDKKIYETLPVEIYAKEIAVLSVPCQVRCSGIVESRVVVPVGTAVEVAIGAVKKDLISALEDRYSIATANLESGLGIEIPRRVFMDEKIMICDYLNSEENISHLAPRIQSLLNITPKDFRSGELIHIKENRPQSVPNKRTYLCLLLIPILLALLLSLYIT